MMRLTQFVKGDYVTRVVPMQFMKKEISDLGITTEEPEENFSYIGEPIMYIAEENRVVYVERMSGERMKFPLTGDNHETMIEGWDYFVDPDTGKSPERGGNYFETQRERAREKIRQHNENQGIGGFHVPFQGFQAMRINPSEGMDGIREALKKMQEQAQSTNLQDHLPDVNFESALEGETDNYDYYQFIDLIFMSLAVICIIAGSSLALLFIGSFLKDLISTCWRIYKSYKSSKP